MKSENTDVINQKNNHTTTQMTYSFFLKDHEKILLIQLAYMHDIMMLDLQSNKSLDPMIYTLFEFTISSIEDNIHDSHIQNTPSGMNVREFANPYKSDSENQNSITEMPYNGKDGVLHSIFRDIDLKDSVYRNKISAIFKEIIYYKSFIDNTIDKFLQDNWKTDKLAYVVRAILRIALFEIMIWHKDHDIKNDQTKDIEMIKQSKKRMIRSYIKMADIFSHTKDIKFFHAIFDKILNNVSREMLPLEFLKL